jgi:hypothetical protein
MKKLIGAVLLGLLALGMTPQKAMADGASVTSITFDGTYASDSTGFLFAAPDESFSISFEVPTTLTSGSAADGFSVISTILFDSSEFSGFSTPAVIDFNPASAGGLFSIGFSTDIADGMFFNWTAEGQQLYTLNSGGTTATLPPVGMFNIVGSPNIFAGASFYSDTFGDLAPISSGTVTVNSAMPEPPPLYLLICGCLALGMLKRKALIS